MFEDDRVVLIVKFVTDDRELVGLTKARMCNLIGNRINRSVFWGASGNRGILGTQVVRVGRGCYNCFDVYVDKSFDWRQLTGYDWLSVVSGRIQARTYPGWTRTPPSTTPNPLEGRH